ncbi:bacillithiol system redox-active protein YtxJ [Salsuginibacillus kocurii]|uniref:bacillithiol system redox-active protein YtxJ n=1 Tax=Salsuginibacillus kocurii TaxID=427078 RepID=UPI000368B977|nr:bacillithiol system redox-active protein YtxJ [Salsuginibacillus kocurii]
MAIIQLKTEEELNQALMGTTPVLLFKHSTGCPISAKAFEEFQSFSKKYDTHDFYFLHVIEDRSLSDIVAKRWAIKHESPQALLLERDRVLWHDSHRAITVEALEDAWPHS